MLTRLLLVLSFLFALPAQAAGIAWQPWEGAFKSAQAGNKLVFLYLEAVWCHWCHVMQKTTFTDAAVQAELARHYIAVTVDHDADPALANRYRDYGWPALIILAPDGSDRSKHAGFMAARDFTQFLKTAATGSALETQTAIAEIGSPRLSTRARDLLLKMHDDSYDPELGGLKSAQKFMDRDSIEYALAHREDPTEQQKAEKTLDAARALIDPVWGGVYQYSTHGDWRHPHYEKIMRVQAGYLRLYALAYGALKRPQDLRSAQAIRDYLFNFLRSPQGAFYVSQDADLIQGQKAHDYFALGDPARRKLGLPRIDKNLYAQENGWAIEALTVLHETSNDPPALEAALRAADWVLNHRALPGGGFSHGDHDQGGPYLGDTLAMGRAFVALHRATGKAEWRHRANQAAAFIVKNFAAPAGYFTAAVSKDGLAPVTDVEENIFAARFFAALSRVADAQHAMKSLTAESFIANRFEEAGILLADEELTKIPR